MTDVTVWDYGATSTSWTDADNWDNGAPAADKIVVVPTGIAGYPDLTGDTTVHALFLQAGGTITGGSNIHIYIDGETAGETVLGSANTNWTADVQGVITDELSIVVTYGSGESKIKLQPSSGSIHDLEINKSGGDNTVHDGALSISGTLWIKDGNMVMQANGDTLSVTEDIKLGNGSDAGLFGHNDHDGAMDARSLEIITSGSTFISTEGVLTLDGKNGSNYSFDNQGGTFTNNSGTLKVTGDGGHIREQGTGNIHHLIVDLGGGSETHRLSDSTTVEGNLTITEGDFQPNGRNLTVAGKTTIGPNSGSADQATLTCSSGTMSLGSTKTDGLGLHVQQGGTFVGGSGTHTMGSLAVDNNAAAKFTNTSGVNTLNGHSNDSTRVIIGGALSTCTAAGTITITYAGGGYNFQNGNAALINNLTLNSNVTANLSAATSITGDLTISQGTLTTTASNYALTVTGELSNAGTFTGNASLVTVRNLLITAGTFTAPSDSGSGDLVITGEGNAGSGDGYAFRRTGGTFTHSSGTVTFTDNTTVSVRMNGVGSGQKFNNVILNEASAGLILQTNDEGFYCEGDLTLTAGDFDLTSSAALVTVDGDVSIANGHTLGSISSQQTANNSFGSLTIASGGTYSATSGTTTIVGAGTIYAGGNPEIFKNSGTLVHNGGTFLNTVGKNHKWFNLGSGNFYNLIMTTGASYDMYQASSDSAYGGTPIVYEGDVTINTGNFRGSSNTQAGTVLGKFTLTGANCNFDGRMGDWSFGSITTGASSTFTATTGIITVTGGLRESDFGGTLSHSYYSTAASGADQQPDGQWAIGGTGGLFEGDFLKNWNGLRINQDQVLNFNGSSTKVQIATHGDNRPTTAVTVSCWAYSADWAAQTDSRLLSCTDTGGYALGVDVANDNKLGWYCRLGSSYELADVALSTISAGWHHIAGTSDGRYNKLYVDGILADTQDHGSTVSIGYDGTPADLVIGAEPAGGTVSSTTQYFGANGKIADVRVYNTVLAIGDLQKLASKMFIGVGAPVAWYKLNEETASGGGAGTGYFQDSGSGGHQGTATGASWTYDDFGVDIQDNTTTVSNLIVENGQLNTTLLNTVDFNGSSGYVDIGSTSGMGSDTTGSWACWIRSDEDNSSEAKIIGFGDANADSFLYIGITNGILVTKQKIAGTMKFALGTDATIDDLDKWVHVAVVHNGTEPVLYVNGVAPAQTFSTDTDKTTWFGDDTNLDEGRIGCYNSNNAGNVLFFDGEIRDVKIYDYNLSADEIASVYRGSNPVIPRLWWKLNETSGNAIQYGINPTSLGTAGVEGTVVRVTDKSLKVNGAARVLTNGSVV